jgi:hypothetical protein
LLASVRKAVIASLFLAAILSAAVWVAPGLDEPDRDLYFFEEHGWFTIHLSWDYKFDVEGRLFQTRENRDGFGNIQLQSFLGQIDTFAFNYQKVTPRVTRQWKWSWRGRFYFQQIDLADQPVRRQTQVEIPCWFVVLSFSSYPALTFFRGPARRWYRYRRGRCVGCGYDLTSLTESRCPECGERFREP